MPWLSCSVPEPIDHALEGSYLIRCEEHPSSARLILEGNFVQTTSFLVALTIPDQLVLKRYFSNLNKAAQVFETLKQAAEDLILVIEGLSPAEQRSFVEDFALRYS